MTTEIEPSQNQEVAVTTQKEVDGYLLRYIGRKSVNQIAQEVGMKPHEVRNRVTELLDNIDVLTVQQQRAQLLITLRQIGDRAMDALDSVDTHREPAGYAQILNAANTSIKVHLQELARMEKDDNQQVTELNNLRVREILKLMDRVVVSSVDQISESYGVDKDVLLEIFQDKLVQSAIEMDTQE